jgi:perosamine synthetase
MFFVFTKKTTLPHLLILLSPSYLLLYVNCFLRNTPSYTDRAQLKLPQEYKEKKFNWYLYTVALKRNNIRDKIKDKMIIQDKIGATVYYNPPVHKTPYYEKMMMISSEANLLTNTNWASEHVLSLPVHPLITEMDIERIENSLKDSLKGIL